MQLAAGPHEHSAYEPLQLFSQRPAAVQAALGALLRTPQNNLRAFQHGQAVPVGKLLKTVATWGLGDAGAVFQHIVALALLASGAPS